MILKIVEKETTSVLVFLAFSSSWCFCYYMFMNSAPCHPNYLCPSITSVIAAKCKQQNNKGCWKLKAFDMISFSIETFCIHYLCSYIYENTGSVCKTPEYWYFEKRLQRRCFTVKFAKLLRIAFNETRLVAGPADSLCEKILFKL